MGGEFYRNQFESIIEVLRYIRQHRKIPHPSKQGKSFPFQLANSWNAFHLGLKPHLSPVELALSERDRDVPTGHGLPGW